MLGDKRTYTVTEKSWQRQVGHGAWVGTVFYDGELKMKMVKIGVAYRSYRGDMMIDIEAEEIGRDKRRKRTRK